MHDKIITVQPDRVTGASTSGGGFKPWFPEKIITKQEMPRPISTRPGRPAAKAKTSRIWGFSSLIAEMPFLSDMMYHKRANDGSVYVRVRPSSLTIENEIVSGRVMAPEKGELYTPGKKRTKYKIRGSMNIVLNHSLKGHIHVSPFDSFQMVGYIIHRQVGN